MNSRRKNSKGITLIALVITIVVLLILAGITIAALNGDNGILTRAKEAKEKTIKAQQEEIAELRKIEDNINENISNTVVEKVTDKNPGVLENDISESNVYVIKSIEDLVSFSYNVRNGNTYEGKTVKLGINLDFNSSKSYVDAFRTDYEKYGYNGELKTLLTSGEGFNPIGTTSNVNKDLYTFSGNFDGNGKKIINLYINLNIEDNENDLRIGLFGNNNGVIKKLGIENCNINGGLNTNGNNTIIVGGIAGWSNGNIEECYVSGIIKGEGKSNAKCRTGGITGNLIGKVKNCYNKANINGQGKWINCVGGISGITIDNSNIESCYNSGTVIFSSSEAENIQEVQSIDAIGGIVGYSYNNTELKNIYNCGNIKLINGNGDEMDIGGIVGYSTNNKIENACNIGEVETNNEKSNIGGIAGTNYGKNGTITKAYYLNKTINGIGRSEQTDNTEKKEDMPNVIDIIGEAFKFDNKNSTYPILNWQ